MRFRTCVFIARCLCIQGVTIMASKARNSADKVAKILNSTCASFYLGLNTEDQTSLLDVLEDYHTVR